ncbi:MAG: DUF3365 domain-containing protein [Planctomycetes bacterium]|nr:DUF3365 domain-containing protein [Planctomycetota bacterium]
MKRKLFVIVPVSVGGALLLLAGGLLCSIVFPSPEIKPPPPSVPTAYEQRTGDEELAYLLVKLLLKTRATMAEHYTREQSSIPVTNWIYQRWLAKNAILPAAVADRVFSGVVPGATGGRAWVKMVVEKPRNPHNQGDGIALELMREIQNGQPKAERSAAEGFYYAEPIKATKTCLPCHGEPEGAPDPVFRQFKREGWREGQIIGAVVARVASKP